MKRTIIIRIAHTKPLRIQQWYRGSDKLPDPDEPSVVVSEVRLTKRTARNGEVSIVITGDPYAINALSHHDDMVRHIRDALGLAFTGARNA